MRPRYARSANGNASEGGKAGVLRGKRDIVEKRGDCGGGARTGRLVTGWEGGGEGGGHTVVEPSLLNVNVRHLLLRLYDPLLFVCICGTGPARRRSRRRRGRIEKAEKEQAPPAQSVALFGAVFAPAFGACPSFFFFYFGLLRAPLAAPTL